jgi:hypothetical protein
MPRQTAGIPLTLPESATPALKKYEHSRSEDDPRQAARRGAAIFRTGFPTGQPSPNTVKSHEVGPKQLWAKIFDLLARNNY